MELDSLYKNADQSIQSLDFLKHLKLYIDFIENDEFLSKVVQSMRENSFNESLSLVKELTKADSSIDYLIKSDIEDKISEQYPLYPYSQLKEACDRFEFVSGYNIDSDVPAERITIVTNGGTSFISKTGILDTAKYSYRNQLKIFHTALLNQIELAKSKGGVFSKYFDYDSVKGILYFQGKEIQINERKKLTNAHYLLAYLFTNEPFEQHFYSELEDELVFLEKKSWSSYYHTCEDIQEKVKQETGIADFLDFSSGTKMYVRINPIYSMMKS